MVTHYTSFNYGRAFGALRAMRDTWDRMESSERDPRTAEFAEELNNLISDIAYSSLADHNVMVQAIVRHVDEFVDCAMKGIVADGKYDHRRLHSEFAVIKTLVALAIEYTNV